MNTEPWLDPMNNTFWTCSAWHTVDESVTAAPWFTWVKSLGCPEHGTEFLQAHPPSKKPTYSGSDY